MKDIGELEHHGIYGWFWGWFFGLEMGDAQVITIFMGSKPSPNDRFS